MPLAFLFARHSLSEAFSLRTLRTLRLCASSATSSGPSGSAVETGIALNIIKIRFATEGTEVSKNSLFVQFVWLTT